MRVNTFTRRKISVTEKENTLAFINYPGWMSSCAEVTIGTRKFDIKRENFWGTKFSILRNGTREIGKIKLCRKSELQFVDALNGEAQKLYYIRRKGIMSWNYEILDEQDNVLVRMKSEWSWRKFSNDLILEEWDETIEPGLLTELVTYTAFVAHHQYRQAAAAS
ncbi:hypothetical protein CEQ90_06260 [Lewinellaceae bacterium SD302]|nr:hypothetical protein CEQ90_06260 [Lewinellaceae bacterium SD302]